MKTVLRVYLILTFITGLAITLLKLGTNPLSLIGILVSTTLVVLVWKGLNFTFNHPEKQNNSRKAHIIRWLMLIYFSILAVELGILVAFILRFFMDPAISRGLEMGSKWAIFANSTGLIGELLLIIIPLIVSLPILYFISKAIGFLKPLMPSVLIFIIWMILLHLPKLLGI